jgi:hypothetical protein
MDHDPELGEPLLGHPDGDHGGYSDMFEPYEELLQAFQALEEPDATEVHVTNPIEANIDEQAVPKFRQLIKEKPAGVFVHAWLP